MLLLAVSLLFLTTLGEHLPLPNLDCRQEPSRLTLDHRLLDKIAKDIMVCENKTIRRWDGSIGQYKVCYSRKLRYPQFMKADSNAESSPQKDADYGLGLDTWNAGGCE